MTKARDISKLLSTANGKIAGASLDVSFENISDSGTAGTKVASGTTGQRGSTAGQIRFNTTTGLAEYYTGSEFKVIDTPPTVTAVSPLEVDSQAGGNITFTITGSNFGSGAVTKFIGNDATEITASTTTVNSGSSISAIIARSSFVNAKEPYDVRVINASGLSGTLDNQINVDSNPTWSTASGQIGGVIEEGNAVSFSVSATDADSDTIVYSVNSGTLPTGLSLNSSTGAITGTAGSVSGDTTSSFTLRATANSKTADRAFSITVQDLGALADAEFYINPSLSSSWSGSGSTIVNITPYASKSASTTNANLNGRSIVTSGGITYINNPQGLTPATATIGNISGNLQNYTFVYFIRIVSSTGGTGGTSLRYGVSQVSQSIGMNEDLSNNNLNHYNYGNDSNFYATIPLTNWKMITLRKTNGTKELFENTTQLSSYSSTNNATNLPSNSTLEIGNRADYNYFSTQTGMVAIWTRSLSNAEISFIYNKFKANYGL